MFQLTEKIGTWLSKKLPAITDKWWDDLVMNNLSTLQRENVISGQIHEIKGLDV